MDVTVIGAGVVGKALGNWLNRSSHPILAYYYDPPKGITDPSPLERSKIVFIAVPTPIGIDGQFDCSYVEEALSYIPGEKMVVIKSTVLPGTTDRLQGLYPQHKLMFSPEFLSELTAEEDTAHPNRNIVGRTENTPLADAFRVLEILPRAPYQRVMRARDAEMVKYFSNAFYAVKVAYANQMYDLCQEIGVDYEEVREAASADPMVGKNHLEIMHKGYRGFGGKCLPKDLRAIISLAEGMDVSVDLLVEADFYNKLLRG